MKKISIGLLVCSAMLLSACSNEKKEASTANSSDKKTEVTAEQVTSNSEKDAIQMSFKDKVLTGQGFKLTIEKTQVAHDNLSGENGLIFWYTFENTSETNMKPADIFSFFTFKQQDATSEYDLTDQVGTFDAGEGLYPMYDTTGSPLEDTDAYNAAVDNQNKFHDDYELKSDSDLLPGKSVQVVEDVLLNNTEYPVVMKVSDDYPMNVNKEVTINLK